MKDLFKWIFVSALVTLLSACGIPDPDPAYTVMDLDSPEWAILDPEQKARVLGEYN